MRGWRYAAAGSRDLRLDFLRGYLIFAMVVDHIGEGSWLHAITGGDRFVISAAEGFVFLSGLVMGMVYRRVIQRDGLVSAARKALGRGAKLYLLHVGLTLGFVTASYLTRAFWFEPIQDEVSYVVDVLTLRQTYYITDVIHLYTVLVLTSPLALLLLARGRTSLLLLASWLLWLVYQWCPWELTSISGNIAFPAAAWQIFFFVGLAIGYHRAAVGAFLGRIPTIVAAPLLGAVALILFAQHLSGNTLLPADSWTGHSYSDIFYKWDVRPGRLLAAAVFFPLAYLLVTVAWRPLLAGLGWFLLPLGQNSLLAYSAHIPIVLVAATVLPQVGLEGPNPGANSAIQLAGVALAWGVVRARTLVPAILAQPSTDSPPSSRTDVAGETPLREAGRAVTINPQ